MNGLLLCIVLPNILFWLAALYLKIDRPFVVLDYLFSAALFAFGWRKFAAVLLAIFLLVDALVIQGAVYPVLHPKDIIYLVSLLPYAPLVWQFAAVGTVLLFATIVAISWKFALTTSRLVVLGFLGVSVLAYAAQSQLDEQSSEFDRTKSTLIGSQAAYYFNTRAVMVLDDFFETRNPLYPMELPGEVAQWSSDGHPQPSKILLIIVESWGAMKDPRAQQALLQPIYAMQDRLDWIKLGQAAGRSTTVEAELLYLCGLGTHYLNLKPVTEGFEGCLPWQLKARGYTTTAIHGAVSKMHERKYWYPRLGFDEIYFSDTGSWETRCYSFPGVCDREIMKSFIPGAFSGAGSHFVYWLTLNTHAPYDARDIWIDSFDCKAYLMDEGSEVCRMNKLHAQFFQQLAAILKQPEMRGVEIFMVGDHSPPVLDQSDFKTHFYRGAVPFLHLRVKQ